MRNFRPKSGSTWTELNSHSHPMSLEFLLCVLGCTIVHKNVARRIERRRDLLLTTHIQSDGVNVPAGAVEMGTGPRGLLAAGTKPPAGFFGPLQRRFSPLQLSQRA